MAKRKKTNNDLQNTIAHDEAYLMQHCMFNGAQYVSRWRIRVFSRWRHPGFRRVWRYQRGNQNL